MDISFREYWINSSHPPSRIYIRSWIPSHINIRAAVQISHGYIEHSGIYEHMARSLCQAGFIVFASDHLGHGLSVSENEKLGLFSEKNGWKHLILDQSSVTELIKQLCGDLPVILYGQGFGSLVSRYCIKLFHDNYAGAIVCGTTGSESNIRLLNYTSERILNNKGPDYNSSFLTNLMFGNYNRKIKSPRTSIDWLSRDEEFIDEVSEDPLCVKNYTVSAFRDIFTLTKRVSDKDWYDRIPIYFPMIFLSGAMDPVGDHGAGVRQVYKKLFDRGNKQVKIHLYRYARHSLVGEIIQPELHNDLADWIDATLDYYYENNGYSHFKSKQISERRGAGREQDSRIPPQNKSAAEFHDNYYEEDEYFEHELNSIYDYEDLNKRASNGKAEPYDYLNASKNPKNDSNYYGDIYDENADEFDSYDFDFLDMD